MIVYKVKVYDKSSKKWIYEEEFKSVEDQSVYNLLLGSQNPQRYKKWLDSDEHQVFVLSEFYDEL